MDDRRTASAAAFASLARATAETAGFQPKLALLIDAATELVPCRWAAIAVTSRLGAEPAKWSTSSDAALGDVIATIASRSGKSPGITAFETGELVHCPDLAREDRFPEYARALVGETLIRSVLSLGIRIRDVTVGVFTLYGAEPRAFDDGAIERARLLGEHAAVAVAAELTADRAENLELALGHSRAIGTAIGILTERLHILPGHAFEKLRVASQHSNRKLSDIAGELIETGTLSGDLGELLQEP